MSLSETRRTASRSGRETPLIQPSSEPTEVPIRNEADPAPRHHKESDTHPKESSNTAQVTAGVTINPRTERGDIKRREYTRHTAEASSKAASDEYVNEE
jgi:hypothetical protein